MKLVEQAVQNTMEEIQTKQTVDWSHMLHLIHLTSMEKSMINQYHNASNISARINLHSLYSENKKGWFPWIFEQINILPDMKILELGCGNGKLWLENLERLPKDIEIILSDTSEGMLRDARRGIGVEDQRFLYKNFDCHHIPYKNESFDIVIANHMLFYCDDIYKVCEEVKRVLKKGGLFVCGTYGKEHMKEVSQLVTEFDERIVLSAEQLYERFGRENGKEILEKYFNNICWNQYVDKLLIQEPEPLIAYVLSCHGNQSQYLTNHYSEFRNFVKKKTNEKFCVTKDAGVFLCYK